MNSSTSAPRAKLRAATKRLRIAGSNLGLGFNPLVSVVLEDGRSVTWGLRQVLEHLREFCRKAQQYIRSVLPFCLQYDELTQTDRNAVEDFLCAEVV